MNQSRSPLIHGRRLIYGCGNVATVLLTWVARGARCNCIRPAAGRPRRERSERREEGKEYSISGCNIQRAARRCSCNGRRIVIATERRHPCRRGTNSRALRKGRSPGAYTIALPPLQLLLVSCRWCYLPWAITVCLMGTRCLDLTSCHKIIMVNNKI